MQECQNVCKYLLVNGIFDFTSIVSNCIDAWCVCVWNIYFPSVRRLFRTELVIFGNSIDSSITWFNTAFSYEINGVLLFEFRTMEKSLTFFIPESDAIHKINTVCLVYEWGYRTRKRKNFKFIRAESNFIYFRTDSSWFADIFERVRNSNTLFK